MLKKLHRVIQKVFVDSSYNTAKSMNDMDKAVFRNMLQKNDLLES